MGKELKTAEQQIEQIRKFLEAQYPDLIRNGESIDSVVISLLSQLTMYRSRIPKELDNEIAIQSGGKYFIV